MGHTKSKKVKKAKNGPNPYLKFALSNSMGQRFAQEKIQRQLVQNEQKLNHINLYTSVSNLAEFEMEQENKQDELNENEEQSDQFDDCSTEVRKMQQYRAITSMPLI